MGNESVSGDEHCGYPVTTAACCASGLQRSSIFHKCFCRSCQFVFMSSSSQVCSPQINREGLARRWANKCLACRYAANLDWGVKLPTSRSKSVDVTWTRSVGWGLKPNGGNSCNLLLKSITCHRWENFSDWERVQRIFSVLEEKFI